MEPRRRAGVFHIGRAWSRGVRAGVCVGNCSLARRRIRAPLLAPQARSLFSSRPPTPCAARPFALTACCDKYTFTTHLRPSTSILTSIPPGALASISLIGIPPLQQHANQQINKRQTQFTFFAPASTHHPGNTTQSHDSHPPSARDHGIAATITTFRRRRKTVVLVASPS